MSALFVALEREIPNFDPYVNGDALSGAERKLERIATELNVTPLMEFFGHNPEDAAAFIDDEGGDPDEINIPDEAWFDAADGLKTADALVNYLSQHTDAIPNAVGVGAELNEWQAVLKRAADEGVRWHLEVDF